MADCRFRRRGTRPKAIVARDGRLMSAVALALSCCRRSSSAWSRPPRRRCAQVAELGVLLALVAHVHRPGRPAGDHPPRDRPATTRGRGDRARRPAVPGDLRRIAHHGLRDPARADPAADRADDRRSGRNAGPDRSPPRLSPRRCCCWSSSACFAVRFLMSSAVASAEDAGPVAILQRSWELTARPLVAAVRLLRCCSGRGGGRCCSRRSVVGGILARRVLGEIRADQRVGAAPVGADHGVAQAVSAVL